MKELSIFIDESGDFGDYSPHSPYYIITMVFHPQDEDIQPAISKLNRELSYLGLDNLCIHTGPIIRREEIYTNIGMDERRKIFNKMVAFIFKGGGSVIATNDLVAGKESDKRFLEQMTRGGLDKI